MVEVRACVVYAAADGLKKQRNKQQQQRHASFLLCSLRCNIRLILLVSFPCVSIWVVTSIIFISVQQLLSILHCKKPPKKANKRKTTNEHSTFPNVSQQNQQSKLKMWNQILKMTLHKHLFLFFPIHDFYKSWIRERGGGAARGGGVKCWKVRWPKEGGVLLLRINKKARWSTDVLCMWVNVSRGNVS